MPVDVILGLQWGDEGKGKIVDYMADQYEIICRFQGGPNAGHTLYINNKKIVLHTIPSGIFRKSTLNLIGNGVVLDPVTLAKELDTIKEDAPDYQERLFISQRAHLILPSHRWLDKASENAKGSKKIGSTLKGIGPTYMDKTGRNGLRVGMINSSDFKKRYDALKEKHKQLLKIYPEVDFDIEKQEEDFFTAIGQLRKLKIIDSIYWINGHLRKGVDVLAEGAQGTMLDLDYGTYPFVTSSNTTTAGVCTGLGVPASEIREVIGITKAYCTRVGSGPFPTELDDRTGKKIQKLGGEFGATTGRKRRCGWLDLVQLNYSCIINGVTQLVVTKIDVLRDFDKIKVGYSYTIDGEESCQIPMIMENISSVNYRTVQGHGDYSDNTLIQEIEKYTGTEVKYLSYGPKREEIKCL